MASEKVAASDAPEGPKTKRITVEVPSELFAAAATRVGSTSPDAVINAALATLAIQDDLGPWLARNWGILAEVPPDVLAQIEF